MAEGLRILRTYPGLSKQHYIIIFNSYLSIRSPKHGLTKSRILPETYIFYWIDPIYSDFTRILPITQIQYTQAYSIHSKSIRYTTKLLGAPEYKIRNLKLAEIYRDLTLKFRAHILTPNDLPNALVSTEFRSEVVLKWVTIHVPAFYLVLRATGR